MISKSALILFNSLLPHGIFARGVKAQLGIKSVSNCLFAFCINIFCHEEFYFRPRSAARVWEHGGVGARRSEVIDIHVSIISRKWNQIYLRACAIPMVI